MLALCPLRPGRRGRVRCGNHCHSEVSAGSPNSCHRLPPPPLLSLETRSKADEDAWRARRNFVRATARGLLAALDYCHSRGVTHGSLSAGSVMLSTLEDQDYDDLVVKLDNFGFGRRFGGGKGSSSSSSSTDADFRAALREDLRAAALLLLETCFAGLKTTQPQAAVEAAAAATGEEWWGDDGTASSSMDAAALNTPASTAILARATLKRLLFDVCRQDVGRLREFCARDASLAKLVEFMDDARGWDCLRELLAGSRGAGELLREGEYFR